ncbi:DUF3313 domain-containing protein [Rhizobium sp. L58/93]|uniref:DUF3313 domain-containing protein n=1 Tax=unclassified Rhizobium TaxID=2613769 RepID=UPI0032AFDED1
MGNILLPTYVARRFEQITVSCCHAPGLPGNAQTFRRTFLNISNNTATFRQISWQRQRCHRPWSQHLKTLLFAISLAALSSIISGCTTADPTPYTGLASRSQLRTNTEDKSGRVPYRFSTTVDWRQYTKIIIDPVTIYRGEDNQFVKLTNADKSVLADYMQNVFTARLKTRFAVVKSPGPQTVRLHLTLTGAKDTTPILGPLSHLDVGGVVVNTAQAVRGREGTMAGSVSYAVEIYESRTNRLLSSYVTKQYPMAMNAGATFVRLKGSKIGIERGADSLIDQMAKPLVMPEN